MIHIKDHKQYDMFSPFEHLGSKRLALLKSSWAHLFREEILHRLPVEKLFPLFDDGKGRPTKELYAMLGLVLLQQMEDLTDNQTIRQYSFNIEWHYALNITDPSDSSCYVAPRTLWGLRDKIGQLGLEQALFENVSETLQKLFNLDTSKQRLDSVHIFSNMAHLGRIRLFVRTNRKFLINLKRHHPDLYHSLDELATRYEAKNDGLFAVRPSDASRTLEQLGSDCFLLVERFKNHEAVVSMASYKLLVRMFGEQCVVEKSDDATKVIIKPNKEVSSQSLQNPSDPDATYCGHKGKGFQMQVMETYSRDKRQPNLITHVKVEAAHENDANALLPAIEDVAGRGMIPTELLADSLYGSDENLEKAKELGVKIISPAMGKTPAGFSLAEFSFSDTGEMIACPEGLKSKKIKNGKRGGKIVHFDKTACEGCPRQSDCPVKIFKNSATIGHDDKILRLAKRRSIEKTENFRDVYRFRSGVEATMSDLDRMAGIKHLRIRGMTKVRIAAVLKVTGLNILRATAFKNRLKKSKRQEDRRNTATVAFLIVVKERSVRLSDSIHQFLRIFLSRNNLFNFFSQNVA